MSKKDFAENLKLFPSNRANNSEKSLILIANEAVAREFSQLDWNKFEKQDFRGQNEIKMKLAESQAMKYLKWEIDHCIFEYLLWEPKYSTQEGVEENKIKYSTCRSVEEMAEEGLQPLKSWKIDSLITKYSTSKSVEEDLRWTLENTKTIGTKRKRGNVTAPSDQPWHQTRSR